MDYRRKFLAAASRQGWAEASGIVCALSGGGDSVAMLWLLKKFFKGRLAAAHLDHCTRDGGSHEDAIFVRELCDSWGIECAVKVADVHHCRESGESFETAGRRARYEHFYETAARLELPYIAVGHNSDDVVETQLMNLARGSGLAGLRGIPEVRGNIVRPVIDFSREELRRILRENGVPWRDDFTNDESDYTRNKVRNILIPWIKENLNSGFEGVMLGLAKQVSAEVEAKESAARGEISKIAFNQPPALAAWRTCGLRELPELTLAEMLRLQGAELSLPALSRARTNELAGLVRRGGCWRFQWARDIEVCYSERGIGWLHRADIKAGKIFSKNTCENRLPWWAR
ncbi:MAG: tRNA lysidine(34) synthetase TilS [Synergistaceae bacterium]|nr:tRNA lysidine(34) synthetase TilS [Synergistaceae bacterium]